FGKKEIIEPREAGRVSAPCLEAGEQEKPLPPFTAANNKRVVILGDAGALAINHGCRSYEKMPLHAQEILTIFFRLSFCALTMRRDSLQEAQGICPCRLSFTFISTGSCCWCCWQAAARENHQKRS